MTAPPPGWRALSMPWPMRVQLRGARDSRQPGAGSVRAVWAAVGQRIGDGFVSHTLSAPLTTGEAESETNG